MVERAAGGFGVGALGVGGCDRGKLLAPSAGYPVLVPDGSRAERPQASLRKGHCKEMIWLLRRRAIRNYWIGQSISLIGDEISRIALPLAAVVILDAQSGEMGGLTAAALVPALLLSVPGPIVGEVGAASCSSPTSAVSC
ncbi:hypothetical protein [Streptomyces celluloflavus]|uniref:hypothetical protein n=1 Tax=Streptomyces celluloflavus TaxID=58344 RepID=UPI0036C11753